MAFLADLRDGTHGIRLGVPSSMRVEQDIEREALLYDDSHSVNWHMALGWAMVDLSKPGDRSTLAKRNSHIGSKRLHPVGAAGRRDTAQLPGSREAASRSPGPGPEPVWTVRLTETRRIASSSSVW